MTPTIPPTVTPSPSAPAVAPRLVGYFYGSDRNNHVSDIPAGQLAAVNYAFIDVSAAGECVTLDAAADRANFPQLQQLKRQYPQLLTIMSIGGYSHSANFSNAALTSDSRLHFAQSCIQFMLQNGFDGIDLDWELPVRGGQAGNVHHPEDKQNLTALLAEFRSLLDAQGAGRHYVLTLAGPAAPSEYANFELGLIHPYLDWINLETYAFYTASSPLTDFNAPLYAPASDQTAIQEKRFPVSGDSAVRGYLAAGVPASKILLGVPFYGRGWQGVPDVNHGLYQMDTGPAVDASVPKGTWSDGAIDYKDLAKHYLGSYPRYWEDQARAPWLYNPATGIMITYDDLESLGVKADYLRTNHLGGMMIWQLSGDEAQHTLVNALFAKLFP